MYTLDLVELNGLTWFYNQGAYWMSSVFLPAVTIVHQAHDADEETNDKLSSAYQIIGDVHDFNQVPLAAARAYKTAIELDPTNARAMWDLTQVLFELGEFEQCKCMHPKCIELDPEGSEVMGEVFDLDAALSEPEIPYFDEDDIYWQFREMIAEGYTQLPLWLLKDNESVEASLCRAKIYGVCNEEQKYMQEWHSIEKKEGEIDLVMSDDYYMPQSVWEMSEYWQLRKRLHSRNLNSPWIQGTDKKTIVVDRRDYADYHISRINRDKSLAAKLANKYPTWGVVKQLNKGLGNK